jgi:transposase
MTIKQNMLQKKELAKILFLNGHLQKEVCDRVGITPKTLQNWIEDNGWKNIRAAKNVTKPELINKILGKIAELIETTDTEKIDGLGDKLAKMANAIEKLDKKSTVVDDIEVFMQFNHWVQQRMSTDHKLTVELSKAINTYQDLYITEKISHKS